MIIQCEQCQTKFKLDDAKVTDKGVKVRCAKCKHVFTVKKEQSEAEPGQDFGALLDDASSGQGEAFSASPELSHTDNSQPQSEPAFDPSAFASDDFSADSFSFDQPEEGEQPPASAPAVDDFSLSSLEEDQGFALAQDKGIIGSEEIDFSGMDFGNVAADADKTLVAGASAPDFGDMTMVSAPTPPVAELKDDERFDFGDESLFGEAVSIQVPDEPTEPINFDFQMDEFADSMGVETSSGDKKAITAEESKMDAPFSMDEIDFGDELTAVAVQQVHPDELKPAQDYLFAPLGETHDRLAPLQEEAPQSTPQTEPLPADQDEMPPLSISSRRKHNPMVTAIIAVVSLIIAAVLAFLGYSLLSEDKAKTVVESGRITVRSVNASFVKNTAAGDLLVITGEAVNSFPKPRAAIQVKGVVYGANGQVLTSRNAYCGNPLTKEQLATMPVDKIEAAMANQFGDSLANMEVNPGTSIPFVVVIPNPPADAKDYGVEPASSTVATSKQ
ncbi:MAG TPA: DUF3426 domain-containing protein [Desulfuromonadaceae bacterium]|jgi:predicted Zn finger-like uncharacterized protein